ncbi:MAG: hypothetical protein EP315_00095, partial [Gammaproteobacteria bacterium]
MKSIRWPGFVAFVVLVALLIGGALLFAGPITKSILESTLSKMNGARVDIASVDISWSPLAMQLNDIQVTDKQQPMINAVQVGNARFQISFGDVLLKKVIIDEMSMNRIEVDTPRKVSGALKKQQKPEMEDKDDAFLGFDMPDMELPDIKEILQIEPLQTDKLIETLNNDFDTTRQQWQASYDDITNQARWDTYQVRYDQIREAFKGNFAQKLAAIKDAKALRDDLKKEIEKVRQIKQQFS